MSIKSWRRRIETSVGLASAYHQNYVRETGEHAPPPRDLSFAAPTRPADRPREAGRAARRRVLLRTVGAAALLFGSVLLARLFSTLYDPDGVITTGDAVLANVFLFGRGTFLIVGLLGALGATLYAVYLVADQLLELRRLDRMRWIDDHEGRLELLQAMRPIDAAKAARVRTLLDAAREGRDGGARIHAGRILRAWTLVAFPLAAIPILLLVLAPAAASIVSVPLAQGPLDDAVGAVDDVVNAGGRVPPEVPAAAEVASPFVGVVAAPLTAFVETLIENDPLHLIASAYLGGIAVSVGALWVFTGLAAQAAMAAGGTVRARWTSEFRDAWRDAIGA